MINQAAGSNSSGVPRSVGELAASSPEWWVTWTRHRQWVTAERAIIAGGRRWTICLPGVREYHDHPGHSGDSWELHRCTGAGTLAHLLGVIHIYGVMRVEAWTVNMVPQLGLRLREPQQ